jgi:hypothetical protein
MHITQSSVLEEGRDTAKDAKSTGNPLRAD